MKKRTSFRIYNDEICSALESISNRTGYSQNTIIEYALSMANNDGFSGLDTYVQKNCMEKLSGSRSSKGNVVERILPCLNKYADVKVLKLGKGQGVFLIMNLNGKTYAVAVKSLFSIESSWSQSYVLPESLMETICELYGDVVFTVLYLRVGFEHSYGWVFSDLNSDVVKVSRSRKGTYVVYVGKKYAVKDRDVSVKYLGSDLYNELDEVFKNIAESTNFSNKEV